MITYPLHSISLEEAMQLQFKVIDCITREFPGHEILTRGDLGVVPGLNKPVTTLKAEKVIARIFDAEAAMLVRGAGTDAIADALYSVRARLTLGQKGRCRRLDRHHLNIGVHLLKILARARNGTAGTHSCDENIHLAVGVAPYFRPRSFAECRRVGRVDKLTCDKSIRHLVCELFSLFDRATHTLCTLGQHQLGTVGGHQHTPFLRH